MSRGRWAVIIVAVCLAVTVAAVAYAAGKAKAAPVPEVVRARKFELVDSRGRCRAVVKLDETGGMIVEVFDSRGGATTLLLPRVGTEPSGRKVGEKLAQSSDIEVRGSWKNAGKGHLYTAEGEATNTGQTLTPFVRIVATFKGTFLGSKYDEMDFPQDSVFAEDFVLAEGSTEMRNLRPGETRRFFISAVKGYTTDSPKRRQATDASGVQYEGNVWDGKAFECVMSAVVEKGSAQQ